MDGEIVIGTRIDTKDFDAEIDYIKSQMDDIEDKLKQADMGFEVGDTIKLEAQYSKLSKQLDKLIVKNKQLNQASLTTLKANIEDAGNSIGKVIKKVGRWALAVFGIRSAYLAVRSAMNTITQYDTQLKADIDYMKNAIAFALEPVVRKIVELMKTLMFYVAYIIKAWTGRDIFANANKSLKQANGEAKKLSKTLAGFDEMNVLSDSSSGGGGGVATPSFDLTAPEDIQPPAWLVWIADNKEIVIAGLLGIAGALVAVKLGINGIIGLGIGIALVGLILLIQDIIKFIKDPSWDNFANILRDLAIVLTGVGIALVFINANNPIGWIMLAVSAIALLVSIIIKNWDKIKAVLGKAVDWIKEKFNSIKDFFKNLIDKIVGFFKELGTKVGNVIGSAFKAVINGVLSAIENILNFPIKSINALIGTINKIPGINLGKLSTFKLPRLAKGGIVNYPGKGVPVGSAITGEAGKEGVIPLTDSQQMQLLGEAIGRYININATIPVYVANRQIAKEIRRINAEDDFAFNR